MMSVSVERLKNWKAIKSGEKFVGAKNKTSRQFFPPRHCEGRRPVAIQCARKGAEAPTGLPRAFGPRNDEIEGKRMKFYSISTTPA
jgi:hypothetical protein